MLSMTITDLSGRNLSGHSIESFWASVRHARPLSIGLNCSFGAGQLRPHIAALSAIADTLIMAYPNAGLPNDLGDYDEGAADDRRARSATGPSRASSTSSAAAAAPRRRTSAPIAEAVAGLSRRARSRRRRAPHPARRHRTDDPRRLNMAIAARRPLADRGGRSAAPSSTSASAPTSPARPASRSWSWPATMPPRSRSRASRSRTAPRSSTSTWTRACSTPRRRWSPS